MSGLRTEPGFVCIYIKNIFILLYKRLYGVVRLLAGSAQLLWLC